MSKLPEFVCLATRRLDDAMPTIVQHLMRALGERTRVLYVEPPVDPVFVWRRRLLRRGGARPRGLHPVVPVILPFEHRFRALRSVNRRLWVRQIRRRVRHWAAPNAVLWLPSPQFQFIAQALADLRLCYYVSDDYGHAPALLAESSPEEILARERWILDRAEWVMVNSPALLDRLRPRTSRPQWVPNGVDTTQYESSRETLVPTDIQSIPKPIAGFIGAVDGYKVDFELLAACSRALPDVSFVTVGPLGWAQGSTGVPPRAPNLHHLGWRPYESLPDYLRVFDVALLPNRTAGYMASNFPMKLFEYFAAGLPVVATRIASLAPFSPWVRLAEDPNGFIEHLRMATAAPDSVGRSAARNIAQNNTWARQAERVLAIVRGETPDPVIPTHLAEHDPL